MLCALTEQNKHTTHFERNGWVNDSTTLTTTRKCDKTSARDTAIELRLQKFTNQIRGSTCLTRLNRIPLRIQRENFVPMSQKRTWRPKTWRRRRRQCRRYWKSRSTEKLSELLGFLSRAVRSLRIDDRIIANWLHSCGATSKTSERYYNRASSGGLVNMLIGVLWFQLCGELERIVVWVTSSR